MWLKSSKLGEMRQSLPVEPISEGAENMLGVNSQSDLQVVIEKRKWKLTWAGISKVTSNSPPIKAKSKAPSV